MGDPTTGHSDSSGSLDGVGYSPSPADGTAEKSAASAVAEEKVSLGVISFYHRCRGFASDCLADLSVVG